MPLFFRYVVGNVVDVSTITRTVAELKANGVNIKFVILDADYYTGINADVLLDAGISFMARRKSNFKVYQDVVKKHLEKLLPLYYMRDQVEKVFELCKQDGKILPINVESEATFWGHLMMTFMACAVLKMMSEKLKNASLTTESTFMNLHEQHVIVYDKEFITTEPVKKMNDAYKVFKVQCPVTNKR